MEINIRRAEPADAEILCRLISENAEKTLRRHYSDLQFATFLEYYSEKNWPEKFEKREIFCAVEGEKIVGTIALEGNWVVGFYTDAEFLGRGIGQKMIRFLEKFAREKNLKKLRLTASPAALDFYLKNGFRKKKDVLWSYKNVDFEETLMEFIL
jgi:GNAT superfamily N-acetyltransferase